MTRIQKLSGLLVLGITAAVSLLAGGILLGGASADEGEPSTPGAYAGAIGLAAGAIKLAAGEDALGEKAAS